MLMAELNDPPESSTNHTADLLAKGMTVFCPITHTHPVEVHGFIGMPHLDQPDPQWWRDFDKPFMDICGALIVAKLPGWDKSKGIDGEIKDFQHHGKPVLYAEAGDISTFIPETLWWELLDAADGPNNPK